MRIPFSAKGSLNALDYLMTGFTDENVGPVIDFAIEVEAVNED